MGPLDQEIPSRHLRKRGAVESTGERRRSIVGIDSSGKCTGWAELQVEPELKLIATGTIFAEAEIRYVQEGGKGTGDDTGKFDDNFERYCIYIRDEIKKVLASCENEVKCVAIEETPSYRGASTKYLIGLYQYLIASLYENPGVNVFPMNSAHMKKVMTGSGKSVKADIVAAVNARFGTEFKIVKLQSNKRVDANYCSDDDRADAVAAAYTLYEDLKK
jgi:Holliday junction resolvasome RuvABC endonuclease subunit